jgi:hypothetical protein
MYGGYFFSRTEQHSSNEELLNGSIWTSREENWDRIPGFKALRSTYIYINLAISILPEERS